MPRRTRLISEQIASVALALTVAACGSVASASRRDQRHPLHSGVRSACSNFELSLTTDRGGEPTAVAAARWFAVHGGIGEIPKHGWKIVASNARTASLRSGTAKLHAIRGVDGTWQVDAGSLC